MRSESNLNYLLATLTPKNTHFFLGSASLNTAHREKMLREKIDYAKYLTWFIENYPASAEQTRENQKNDAFWAQFK